MTCAPADSPARPLKSMLAEPYAFAMLTWPAAIALATRLAEGWPDWTRTVLIVWLAAMHCAAYAGGRGLGFGNAVLLMSGIVVLACTSFPSPWTLAWLPALLVALHAAQCIGLERGAARPANPSRLLVEKSADTPAP